MGGLKGGETVQLSDPLVAGRYCCGRGPIPKPGVEEMSAIRPAGQAPQCDKELQPSAGFSGSWSQQSIPSPPWSMELSGMVPAGLCTGCWPSCISQAATGTGCAANNTKMASRINLMLLSYTLGYYPAKAGLRWESSRATPNLHPNPHGPVRQNLENNRFQRALPLRRFLAHSTRPLSARKAMASASRSYTSTPSGPNIRPL